VVIATDCKIWVWAALGGCVGLCCNEGVAQSTTTVAQSETVVVTAEKRREPLGDVPMSIVAATATELDNSGVSSPGDLEKIVSGFTYTPSPYGAPIFTIRGVGFFDESVGAAPTVSVYVDQVPLPFSRMTEGAGLDLERVEVLKGPQGTLFGQNSTGGAINYIPAKPTDILQSGAKLDVGRLGHIGADGFVSGPLAETLTARLAVLVDQTRDWQQSVSRADSRGVHRFANVRLLADYRPSSAFSLEFSAGGWLDRSDTQAGQFLAFSPTTPSQQGGFTGSPVQPNLVADLQALAPTPHTDRAADWDPGISLRRNDIFHAFSLRGDLNMAADLTLTFISAYSDLRLTDPSDDDGTQYENLRVTVQGKLRSVSEELRLAGGRGRAHWTVGSNYEHDMTHDLQHILNQGTNSGLFKNTPLEYRYFTLGNLSDQKIDTAAVFASGDYGLTDALTAQGSVRYTDTKRVFDGCLLDGGDGQFGRGFGLLSNVLNGMTTFPAPGDPGYIGPGACATLDPSTNRPLSDVHNSVHERNVSWRLGLSLKAAPDLLLYANATQGFKAGNFGTLPLIYPTQAASVPAERLLAYENGIKKTLLNGRIDITGAGYYYDYRNKQLLGYINTGQVFGDLPGEVSIPKSRVIGGELSLTVRPTGGLSVRLGASRVDTKVTTDYFISRPVSTVAGLQNINGERFPETPKWNLIATADYTRGVTPAWNAFLGGNTNMRTSTYAAFAPTPDFHIAGYTLLDLRAGFERNDNSLRIEFWGHNVTDRYYWTHVARIQDTIYRLTGMPATYGVTISARY